MTNKSTKDAMKRRSTHKWIATVLALVLMLPASACSLRPKRTEPEAFRLGFTQTADNLNPYGSSGEGEAAALALLYDTLFVQDPATGEYVSGLCTGHTTSRNADGSYSWDLEIQSGVFWHDGEPLTAEDVMFTLKTTQLFSNLYASPDCDFFYGGNMTVLDDTHLSFVVWDDYPYMEEYLSRIPILPEHIWNALPYMQYTESSQAADHALAARELPRVEPNASTMIGSGPFRWGGFEDGVCRLYRNENYWNGAPQLSAVELVYGVADPLTALQEGTLQGCWNLSALDAAAAEESGFLTASGSTGDVLTLSYNLHEEASTGNTLLLDKTVRQAIDVCIDRPALLTGTFGDGHADAGLLRPRSRWYYDVTAFDSYRAGGAEEGNFLLDWAGYTDQNGDGIRERTDGTALSFELLCSAADPAWAAAAQLIRQACTGIGVEIRVTVLTGVELHERTDTWDYDMYLTGWTAKDDPAYMLGLFWWDNGNNAFSRVNAAGELVYSGWNDSGYASGTYDGLYEKMLGAGEDRRSLVTQLGQQVYDDAAITVLGWPLRRQACSGECAGLVPDSSGLFFTAATLRQQLSAVYFSD